MALFRTAAKLKREFWAAYLDLQNSLMELGDEEAGGAPAKTCAKLPGPPRSSDGRQSLELGLSHRVSAGHVGDDCRQR